MHFVYLTTVTNNSIITRWVPLLLLLLVVITTKVVLSQANCAWCSVFFCQHAMTLQLLFASNY